MTEPNRRTVDVVVIGAGPVGENVADRTSQAGLDTLLVERELVGGECSYWACVPSKAMLRSAHVLRLARSVPGAAEAVTGELDVAAVLARRDRFTDHRSDAGALAWLDSAGIGLLRGNGRLSGAREVTVTSDDGVATVVTARHAVVVSTGSVPVLPDIPGLADVRPWSSRDATSATTVPDRLAILGGGTVATEIATAYAGYGSGVTVVARGSLLGSFEPFVGEQVAVGLRKLGVRVLERTAVERVERIGADIRIVTDDGVVEASELLVATGRRAAVDGLGLETAGVDPARRIDVDDTMLVAGSDWLYAVGDVNGRALLTHQGKYQARAAGDAIAARAGGFAVDVAPWGAHVATADHRAVPSVVFTAPEVATVGLTASGAREAGLDVRVVDYEIGDVSGAALSRDGFRGTARMVVDESRGVVVGVTFTGPDVAELLHAATTAIVGEVPIGRLWHAVPAFPTVSEVWLRLLEGYGRPALRR
ncbi:dihydrolipoyl dehydrogenase family protein [Agromyces soli]